jgi:hypothetical protein
MAGRAGCGLLSPGWTVEAGRLPATAAKLSPGGSAGISMAWIGADGSGSGPWHPACA